jgi:integrase
MNAINLELIQRRQRWDRHLRESAIVIFRDQLQNASVDTAGTDRPLAADEWLWIEENFWSLASQEGLHEDTYAAVAETIESFGRKSLRDRMLDHLYDSIPMLADEVRQLATHVSVHEDAPIEFAVEQAELGICRQLALVISRLRTVAGEAQTSIYPTHPFVLMHSTPDPLSILCLQQAKIRSDWAGQMGVADCWGQAHAGSLVGTPRLSLTVGGKIDDTSQLVIEPVSVARQIIVERDQGSISADLRMRMSLMTASQLAEEFIAACPVVCQRAAAGADGDKVQNWCEKTRQQFRSAARLATKFFGIKPFMQLRHADFVALYKKLLQLPVDHHTNDADNRRTLEQIVARGKQESAELLKPITATRHMNNLRLLHTWTGTAFNLPLIEWSDVISWAGSERVVNEILTMEQVQELFHLPIWTGAANYRGMPIAGEEIWHGAFYWVPLMLWYTGVPRDVLCALLLQEIVIADGLDCIRVPTGGRRGFERVVPLHPELLRLGFLKYVDALRAEGEKRLFPELQRASGQSAADVFSSRCWRPIRQALPSLPIDCAAGAIRDAAERALNDGGAFEEKVKDLFGVRGSSEADLRYTRIAPPSHLAAIVQKIPATTSHLEASPIRLLPRRARQKTAPRIVPQVQKRLDQEQALGGLLPHRRTDTA